MVCPAALGRQSDRQPSHRIGLQEFSWRPVCRVPGYADPGDAVGALKQITDELNIRRRKLHKITGAGRAL
jgi:hypothetical protein